MAVVGHPDRKPQPTGVQVASSDAVMSDAIVDGGTTDEDVLVQTGPSARADRDVTHGLPVVHGVPKDAVSHTAGDGTQFYAPPDADFQAVYADGKAHWLNFAAAYSSLKQFAVHDFQREGGKFYPAYTDASNYAVGVYLAGAGFSYDATIKISTLVADVISSNANANTQAPWWTRGWKDATNGTLSRPHRN